MGDAFYTLQIRRFTTKMVNLVFHRLKEPYFFCLHTSSRGKAGNVSAVCTYRHPKYRTAHFKVCLSRPACPEQVRVFFSFFLTQGLAKLRAEFPEVTIVTGAVDDCLDERKYILPGLGDFGDRL